MEASDRTDDASENSRVEPLSLKMYEPDLARCANCGAFIMLGLENASAGSPGGKLHWIFFSIDTLLLYVPSLPLMLCCFLTKLLDGDKKGLPDDSRAVRE